MLLIFGDKYIQLNRTFHLTQCYCNFCNVSQFYSPQFLFWWLLFFTGCSTFHRYQFRIIRTIGFKAHLMYLAKLRFCVCNSTAAVFFRRFYPSRSSRERSSSNNVSPQENTNAKLIHTKQFYRKEYNNINIKISSKPILVFITLKPQNR